MNSRQLIVASASILLLDAAASGHRLDEYLQAAMFSVEKNQVQVQMRLVPGVAVSSFIVSGIDSNSDGLISGTEQSAYAERVLRDVSLMIDGKVLKPKLISAAFPTIDEMKEGLGEIRLEFSADLPRGGPNRRLVFENRHQSKIAAYLVNCLVPSDPDIRIVAQNRDERQSFYQLDYAQAGVSTNILNGWMGLGALLLLARLEFLWRQRRLTRGLAGDSL